MRFLDMAGNAADVSAIPVALVGFGLTFWQLRKTRRAAEAAHEAAKNAQDAISRSNVLVLIPQLQRIEEELDRAVAIRSAELIRNHLKHWRWQAGQLRGLLKVGGLAEDGLLTDIQESVSGASEVAGALIGSVEGDLAELTEPFRVRL